MTQGDKDTRDGAAQRQIRAELKDICDIVEGYDEKFTTFNSKIDDLFERLSKKIDDLTTTFPKDSELNDSIEKVREHVSNKLAYENQKLNYRVNLLEKRLLDLEREFTQNNQHGRKFNFQIDGIPKETQHKDLESTVVDLLNAALPDRNFIAKNIEACHRISKKSNTTIVRLDSRKDVDMILGKAKLFPKLKTDQIKGMNGAKSKVFINHNLNPNLNNLAYNCRLLKREKLIEDTWSANGKVKIKQRNGEINIIGHEIDIYRLFPEFPDFTFDIDFLQYVDNDDHYPEFDDDLSTDSEYESASEQSHTPRKRSKNKSEVKLKI